MNLMKSPCSCPRPTVGLTAMIKAWTCALACLLGTASAQQAAPKVLTGGRAFVVQPATTSAPSARSLSLVSNSTVAAPSSQALVDELARLRLEMAAKVKEIEKVRLLDPALGAHLQTSLADLNAQIKNAEIALVRADDREREHRETEKLKLIQEHELRMVDKQHQNQKELMQSQQNPVRFPATAPVEKDFLEQLADGLEANASFQKGFHQLQSTDTAVQADGLRKMNTAIRQASPPK